MSVVAFVRDFFGVKLVEFINSRRRLKKKRSGREVARLNLEIAEINREMAALRHALGSLTAGGRDSVLARLACLERHLARKERRKKKFLRYLFTG